jgi:Flp pilus assembly protein TadD
MFDIAKKPSFTRDFCIATASVLILLAVGYVGWRLYKKLEPPRLAKRAQRDLEQGNFADARLAIGQALNINPKDLAVVRLVAEIAETASDSSAVGLRRRLMDLQPGSLNPALDCAETALRFRMPDTAEYALRKANDQGKADPRFHEVFGRTAAALNQPNLAVEHFAEAARLNPANQGYQLLHAAALLERGWLEDRPAARGTLEGLSAVPNLRVAALRALVRDSIANYELSAAVRLARDLAAEPDANFSDQLTLVDLLRHTGSPDVNSALASALATARGEVAHVAEALGWMNRSDRAREALEWSNSFSPEEWSDPRVCAAVAQCALTLKDWPRLEALTNGGTWQGLEYVRCALLARAFREQGGNVETAQIWWDTARNAAANQPGATVELARLIADWGWEVEFEALLRLAADDPKGDPWMSRLLLERLMKKKDTVGLWKMSSREVAANPEDDAAGNNFAMYSFLLNREVTRACQLAQMLYRKHPREFAYVSTYAYSLHLLGRSRQAVEVMDTLGPEELEAPNLAAYYGIFLAATGDRERAASYLKLGESADLMPEERELVRLAQHQLE